MLAQARTRPREPSIGGSQRAMRAMRRVRRRSGFKNLLITLVRSWRSEAERNGQRRKGAHVVDRRSALTSEPVRGQRGAPGLPCVVLASLPARELLVNRRASTDLRRAKSLSLLPLRQAGSPPKVQLSRFFTNLKLIS